jgi:hypothetical protein
VKQLRLIWQGDADLLETALIVIAATDLAKVTRFDERNMAIYGLRR